MVSQTVVTRSLKLLVVIILAAIASRPVQAQRLDDGKVAFESKARESKQLRAQLLKGDVAADPKDKSHQDAIDIAAKAVTYPLKWDTPVPQSNEVGKLEKIVEFFASDLNTLTKNKDKTAQAQQMYCRQVIDRADEVIRNSKPIAGINAARILAKIIERGQERFTPISEKAWFEEVQPRLAEGNAEYFVGVLLALLDDAKVSDGVKYYVLHTLTNLLTLQRQSEDLLKKETVEKALRAGIKIVEKKVIFSKSALRAETEREKILHREVEGYRVLRREAVKLVAQSRVAAFADKDRPALILARVVGNDKSIVPSPRLDESIEAVIGLARISAGAVKSTDYQPDYVMFHIAGFVESFGLAANQNIQAKTLNRRRPWRIDAARLIEALDTFKAGVKSEYVQRAVPQCLGVLSRIEIGELSDANVLGDWLSKNPPASKSVFSSAADSTIQPVVVEKEKKPAGEKDK